MTKKQFAKEWCETIQTNIWKNEMILEFKQSLPEPNQVEIDATMEAIKKDTESLNFFKDKYEVDNKKA